MLVIVSFLVTYFHQYLQAEDTYKGQHSKSLPRTNEKILSIFFASNLATYFIKIIGTWVCDICIICKIYFDIIKEQIKNNNIKKKRGPGIKLVTETRADFNSLN